MILFTYSEERWIFSHKISFQMQFAILCWCIPLVLVSGKKRWDEEDRVIFPGPVRERRMSTLKPERNHSPHQLPCDHGQCHGRNDNVTMLPMNLVRELNEVHDLQDISHLISNRDEFISSIAAADTRLGTRIESRFGSDEPVKATYTKLPDCIPQPTLVPLQTSDLETSAILIPSCIRVDRCSGCCHEISMECNPINTEKQSYKISVFKLDTSNSKFRFVRFKSFTIDKHIKCRCGCKTKARDCNPRQTYYPELCHCECNNWEERDRCNSDSDRYWDEDTCTCGCTETSECSTGTYFDYNQCRCVIG